MSEPTPIRPTYVTHQDVRDAREGRIPVRRGDKKWQERTVSSGPRNGDWEHSHITGLRLRMCTE
jgi:hypothetical protein